MKADAYSGVSFAEQSIYLHITRRTSIVSRWRIRDLNSHTEINNKLCAYLVGLLCLLVILLHAGAPGSIELIDRKINPLYS